MSCYIVLDYSNRNEHSYVMLYCYRQQQP